MTEQPLLRIITPSTTSEEIAAIVTVLASLGGGEPAAPEPRSEWASPARRMRGAPATSWRASGLPH
ncbi:acyl-CoA carboxylase subunit epsilon [Nocardioides sp.]|uniref:acyl-CoA carboxylase subunit epsilon n=1 Tax=Nocardioides sp. TaxID=35761 RepID=UPI0039E2626A